MKLSLPVHLLKRQARTLSRNENIPLHEALDRIARREGFNAWSLLARRAPERQSGNTLMAELEPGDLMLLGARPGHGKTLLSLELLAQAMKVGQHGVFFTLDLTDDDIAPLFATIGEDLEAFRGRFDFDDSDDIHAGYIISRLQHVPRGSVVVIDYLQLLDQKREHPVLADQVRALKDFARDRGLVFVFISQIDRRFDSTARPFPELTDVRLPNPLDLTLFDKACFLNDGDVKLSAVS